MTDRDLDNLTYLLSFSADQLQDWMATRPEDDRKYALELLTLAPHEIIDLAVDLLTSYPEAMKAIKPFMITK